jgi:hypothetical protein
MTVNMDKNLHSRIAAYLLLKVDCRKDSVHVIAGEYSLSHLWAEFILPHKMLHKSHRAVHRGVVWRCHRSWSSCVLSPVVAS